MPLTCHNTGIPCPACAAGRVQWAKINFHREVDNAFDWRLDAWCCLCGHGLAGDPATMREIRIRYNEQLGKEIEGMQEAALVQVIGPRMNGWMNRAVSSRQ